MRGISREIAQINNYTQEEQDLAELIGLLHDIGRFEQVRLYNTFNDGKSVNHAELGVQILFEEGLIREFIEDSKYDELIKKSILNHNKPRIPRGISDIELKFSKIIRDADKVDIFYVLITDKLENCYGKADFSDELISDEILYEFKELRKIDYKKRESHADIWVSHIAYVFDFNYDFCLKKIKDGHYIEKLLEKVNFTNKETIMKANEIVKIANEYIDNIIK